jgi:hypothetical protein
VHTLTRAGQQTHRFGGMRARMDVASEFTEIEQQLLMAAAFHALGTATDLSRANTALIVNQVLRWRGLTVEQVNAGWRDEDCDPEHNAVYAALVRMTHQRVPGKGLRPGKRQGPALFEGSGNWGVPGDPDCPPCWPHFNSCRLTSEGERLALLLIAQHPEYRKSAEPGRCS